VGWVVSTHSQAPWGRQLNSPSLHLLWTAHQQRAHPRGEEGVRVPLAGLHAGAEALQGTVHAGGAHAEAHGREATQVHGELAQGNRIWLWLIAGSPGWNKSDRAGHGDRACRCVLQSVPTLSASRRPLIYCCPDLHEAVLWVRARG
jgi:hypothetical protein